MLDMIKSLLIDTIEVTSQLEPMAAYQKKNRVSAASDEPSPFLEDRPGYKPVKRNVLLSKPWPWLIALVIAGVILFSWAQRPASTPTRTAPAETEAPE